ncbi:MAG: insulinase family protein [Proteobacteria bacterium]|nr:MAG: insulinase family protein [Pseudomonadota bacterium]
MKLFPLSLAALSLLANPAAQAALKIVDSGKAKNFLYEQDAKALASNVQLVFRTGNLSDPQGKEGLANLAFEALLRGTKGKARKEFFAATERIGASLSTDTGSNRTIISLDALSDNLEPAIQLLAEAILQPGLKDEEINSLKQEEIAQISQELANNRSVLKRVARQALYRGTPLAFPPNGTTAGLNAITPDDVRGFLSAQVKAGNVVLAVMSNHNEALVKGWLEKAFANLPEGAAPPTPKLEFAPLVGRRLYVVDRAGSSTTEMAIAQRAYDAAYKDRDILEVGNFVFGGDMSSRLFVELRAKKGWTYGAYSFDRFLEIPRNHGGSFLIYAFPATDHTQDATLRALELYREYVSKGLTAKELEFAKRSLTNAYPFKFATSKSRLVARLYQFLDGAPLLEVPAYRKEINSLTRPKLLKAIQKIHDPENLAVVLVGDPAAIEKTKAAIPNLKETIVVADPEKELPSALPPKLEEKAATANP